MTKPPSQEPPTRTSGARSTLTTFIPMNLRKRPDKYAFVAPEESAEKGAPQESLPDTTLINGLAKAFYWQRLLDLGIVRSGQEIAKREGLDQATVNECMRLTLLDPKLVEFILGGVHPKGLTLNWLTRNPIPLIWSEQHERFESIARSRDPRSGK